MCYMRWEENATCCWKFRRSSARRWRVRRRSVQLFRSTLKTVKKAKMKKKKKMKTNNPEGLANIVFRLTRWSRGRTGRIVCSNMCCLHVSTGFDAFKSQFFIYHYHHDYCVLYLNFVPCAFFDISRSCWSKTSLRWRPTRYDCRTCTLKKPIYYYKLHLNGRPDGKRA